MFVERVCVCVLELTESETEQRDENKRGKHTLCVICVKILTLQLGRGQQEVRSNLSRWCKQRRRHCWTALCHMLRLQKNEWLSSLIQIPFYFNSRYRRRTKSLICLHAGLLHHVVYSNISLTEQKLEATNELILLKRRAIRNKNTSHKKEQFCQPWQAGKRIKWIPISLFQFYKQSRRKKKASSNTV